MALPQGFERKDEKKSEEVHIPAATKAPVEIGRDLIKISSLDYVGQMAFQGVKTLNRIQSVVFDTAYRTNENLLVCAPTGAGKTNVAMLCIVQTIRQFLEGKSTKIINCLRSVRFKKVNGGFFGNPERSCENLNFCFPTQMA